MHAVGRWQLHCVGAALSAYFTPVLSALDQLALLALLLSYIWTWRQLAWTFPGTELLSLLPRKGKRRRIFQAQTSLK
jgi:hypothetical protein